MKLNRYRWAKYSRKSGKYYCTIKRIDVRQWRERRERGERGERERVVLFIYFSVNNNSVSFFFFLSQQNSLLSVTFSVMCVF